MGHRQNIRNLLLFLALVWVQVVTGYWLLNGWHLRLMPRSPSLLGGFPVRQLVALVGGAALGGVLTLAGWQVARAAGWSRATWAERGTLAFLLGGAICGAAAGWVAFAVVMPGVVAIVAVGVALAARRLRPRGIGPRPGMSPAWPIWMALGALVALTLLAALAPAVESDGLRYHLVAPREWLRAGRFVPLPYNANANLPALQGLLVAQGTGTLELGRVYQVLHTLHAVALAIACGAVARRLYRAIATDPAMHPLAERAVAATTALVAFSIPTVGVLAAWPFSDVAAAAYFVGGLWLTLGGGLRARLPRLGAAGLLLGAALAAKISLLPVVGIVGLALLARAVAGRAPVAAVAVVIVAGLAVLGPWLVKSTLYHGNPVYPLAYGVFGGPEWSPENAAFYSAKAAETGIGRTVEALLRSPLEMTRAWPRFESHNPGPMLLALLPMAMAMVPLALLRRRGAWAVGLPMAVLVAGWVVWWQTYQSVRFFLPQLLMIVVLAVPCVFALMRRRVPSVAMMLVLIAMALASGAWPVAWRLWYKDTYNAVLGFVGDDVRIAENFNAYPAVLWLNRHSEPGEPVFYIGEHRAAYAETYRPLASDWFDTPLVLVEIRATLDNDALLAGLRQRGVRRVLLNQAELGLYEVRYFQPRFSPDEWERFTALRQWLLQRPHTEVSPGIRIIEIGEP